MDGGIEGSMKKYNPRFTTFTQIKAPCKGCDDRKLHCHDTCERYQEYNRQMIEIRERRAEKVKINDTLYANQINRNRNLMEHGRRNVRGQK